MKTTALFAAAAAIALIATGAQAQTASDPVQTAQAGRVIAADGRPDAQPGFYVRGSLGYSWSAQDEIDYSPVWGLGVGYRFTPNLRADFTIDWRDRYIIETGTFDTKMSNKSFMLNAYYDLDQLPIVQLPGGFKPYVGAGIGLSFIEVNDQTIVGGGGTLARAFGEDDAHFAWQLMAGVGYQFTPKLTFDLGYRYAHLGEASLQSTAGSIDNDLNTHEILATLRYTF